jgi:hypothetical protein
MDDAPEHPPRNHEPRRAEEKAVAENVTWLATQLATGIAAARKAKWLLGFVIGAVIAVSSAISGYAAWAGAQQSSPGQVIAKQGIRIDSVVRGMVVLDSTVKLMQATQDSILRASDGKFDLLLRISCRGLEFRDLLAQCRAVGANR